MREPTRGPAPASRRSRPGERNELELERIEADAVKRTKEAACMDLTDTLDKMWRVVTAALAGAAVLAALDTIAPMGGA